MLEKIGTFVKTAGTFVMTALVETGLFWVLWKVTGQHPTQPTAHDLKTAKGAAQAAINILVGKKSEKGDEAIFSGLVSQLEPRLQDNLDELLEHPKMTPERKREFRWTISLLAEKADKDFAVNALKRIADLPTAEERYQRALNHGLLEPENSGVAKAKLDAFIDTLGSKLVQAAGGIKNLHSQLDQNFNNTGLSAWAKGLSDKAKTWGGF